MRFVPIKSEEQQAMLVLHRVRETLVGQRIQLINAIRGHMAEFGIVVAQRGWQRSAADQQARRSRRTHSYQRVPGQSCRFRPISCATPSGASPDSTTNSRSRRGRMRRRGA